MTAARKPAAPKSGSAASKRKPAAPKSGRAVAKVKPGATKLAGPPASIPALPNSCWAT